MQTKQKKCLPHLTLCYQLLITSLPRTYFQNKCKHATKQRQKDKKLNVYPTFLRSLFGSPSSAFLFSVPDSFPLSFSLPHNCEQTNKIVIRIALTKENNAKIIEVIESVYLQWPKNFCHNSDRLINSRISHISRYIVIKICSLAGSRGIKHNTS